MKHAVFMKTCLAVSLMSGCTLPDPITHGEACRGIEAKNIVWGTSDACMLYGNGDRQLCDEEAQDVVQLAGGYCPIGFICRQTEEGQKGCVHSCPDGQVFCGDACINPQTSISYCGATLGGMCNSDQAGSNYYGKDCMKLVRSTKLAHVCDENGECKPTGCKMDEYVRKDKTCQKNNDSNCGEEGKRCAKDESCIFGDCKKDCPKGYIRCYSEEDGDLCIHPQNNSKFCGAKGQCQSADAESEDYRGVACGEGMLCVQGECVVWKCAHENERVCNGLCVDVSKDPFNCGGCSNRCESHRLPHVTSAVTCKDHRCVYTCEEGYENCATDGSMECVDMTWHPYHCGSCGHACEKTEYCMNGTCKADSCKPGFVPIDGECLRPLVVGDEIEFGRYPQSENSDIPSPLIWQVLEVTEDSALLISKYVLEKYPYHDKDEEITWGESDVRSYLNGLGSTHNKNGIDHETKGFIDRAFTAEERSQIKKVTNTQQDGLPTFGLTPGGNPTDDWVFLLNYEEAYKYFPTKKSLIAAPTAYAIHPPESSGRANIQVCQATCSEDNSCHFENCNNSGENVLLCSTVPCRSMWWRRSAGHPSSCCAVDIYVVDGGNHIDLEGSNAGIRPALYLSRKP